MGNFDIHQWQAKFLKEESSNIKTAVEWLEEKLPSLSINDDNDFYKKLFKQAKELQKQQIEDAYEKGISDGESGRYTEEYYNSTYK